ncbi:MAG TPA: hypothetical protein VM599_09270 [Thermoanaerobaculia bacterium]|nr:hypothetical protein [Thermoanaerobaculia bacterium]
MTTPAPGGDKLLPYTLWCAALSAAAALLGPVAAPLAAQGAPALVFEEALRGSEEREVRWPVAVAAASADELAVADAFGPRLLVFRRAGVGWQAARVAELPGAPAGLAWDGARWVVSVRGGGGLVALEGEDLLQRRLPLPAGVVPGALAALPGGGLLVHDAAGGRILRLGADGRSAGEIAVAGPVTGLAAAPGAVMAAFGHEGVVRRFDAAGGVEATWTLPADGPVPAWPAGIAVSPAGDTYVADRHNGRIAVLDPTGRVTGFGARKGWDPGLLLFPSGIALLPDGRLAVADQGNGRVQLYRRTGGGAP